MLQQIFAPLANPDHLLAFALCLFLETLLLLLFVVPQRHRLDALEALSAGDRLTELRARFDALEVAAANHVADLGGRLQRLEGLGAAERLAQLEELSYYDPLTSLRSGSLFRAELAALVRPDRPSVLLYLDLDNFGEANDQGHGAGDLVLVLAAQALRQAVPRGSDRLYRLHRAGDEFAAFAEVDEPAGLLLADRVLEALNARGLSATIGLASSERYGWRDLEGAADRACMAQKKQEKGRCRIAIEPPICWSEHFGRVEPVQSEGSVGPHLLESAPAGTELCDHTEQP